MATDSTKSKKKRKKQKKMDVTQFKSILCSTICSLLLLWLVRMSRNLFVCCKIEVEIEVEEMEVG